MTAEYHILRKYGILLMLLPDRLMAGRLVLVQKI